MIREHGSGTRAILTKTLALKNMSVKDFRHLVEIENIHTIVTLLKEDCGISFLYKDSVEQELKKGSLLKIPLSDFIVMHDFTFVWKKDSVFSQEYESIFHELCENYHFVCFLNSISKYSSSPPLLMLLWILHILETESFA